MVTKEEARTRVLLAVDSPDDRALARREAASALPEAQIEEADSPEALEGVLAHAAVDLAILGCGSGGSAGPRMLARLREADPTAAAILLTHPRGEEGAVEAMKAGFDDYVLEGPAAGPRLRNAIGAALARLKARREAMAEVTTLRDALRQKEALLREVFHRVYNNLQQVEALLNLQGRRFEDPDIRRAFKDVGERLRSLALVQQKLSQGGDYRSLNFAAYLQDLSATIATIARRPDIEIAVDAEPVAVEVDKAVALGLIANELLSNAVKHAFTDGRGGRIDVVLKRESENSLRLEVSDNGVGADPKLVSQGSGLGARLIPNLARQLSADMTVEDAGGLRTTLHAPL